MTPQQLSRACGARIDRAQTFLPYLLEAPNPDEPSAGSGPEDKLTMYGDNLPRLRTVKKKYDPRNVFCVNSNILPAK